LATRYDSEMTELPRTVPVVLNLPSTTPRLSNGNLLTLLWGAVPFRL